MKRQRLGIALLLVAGALLTEFSGVRSVGFSVKMVNQDALVQGGSSPWLILWAIVAIPFFAFAMTRDISTETVGVPSWKRRFAAFVIDFYVAMMAMTPFAALIPLAAEAHRTGRFAWYFQRTYTVNSDFIIAIPLAFVMMGLLAVYFAWPIVNARQTIGCYLLGLKVAPVESTPRRFGMPRGLRRVFLGFIGLCSWPFIWLLGRGKDGSTWYDRSTNCRVHLVRYL